MKSPVYTLTEAAKFLRLSVDELRVRLQAGHGPRQLMFPAFVTDEPGDADPVFHLADLTEYRATVTVYGSAPDEIFWGPRTSVRN